ncbi:hypothetical protein GKZ89_18755 [Bacillus mangrovi]|uniref:Uncharacterized protein n=2 Tax=Metabacillus mangrovi TaxID=1491830 RepID=A0A7X2S8Y4_9BACI|nr:hypothetical protein [Metabacillus mangrovi]
MVDKSRLRKETEDFEAGFPDGDYAIPPNPSDPIINVPKMFKWCKKHGRDPESLSKKEMKQFFEYQ